MLIIRLSAFAVVALLLSQTNAAAQYWGRPPTPVLGACFYEDIDYGGSYFCAATNTSNPEVTYRMNNRISSIRLFGSAEVTIYVDRDFRGRSRTFGSSVSDLRRGGWNDRVSSYRIRSTGRGSGDASGRSGRGGGYGSLEMATGRMEWRGRVDDRLHLAIRGSSVEQRTISGTTLAAGRAIFTSGLPNETVRVSVEKLSGRGTVRIVQQPARSNDFTAIIEIVDDGGGSQEYRIDVTWR